MLMHGKTWPVRAELHRVSVPGTCNWSYLAVLHLNTAEEESDCTCTLRVHDTSGRSLNHTPLAGGKPHGRSCQ